MGLSRLEFWRGLPFPSPGNLPNPEIKATSLTSPALAGGFFFFPTSATWEALKKHSKLPISGLPISYCVLITQHGNGRNSSRDFKDIYVQEAKS